MYYETLQMATASVKVLKTIYFAKNIENSSRMGHASTNKEIKML